jgi:EmrB/QacA subfamily drug resistance transporter
VPWREHDLAVTSPQAGSPQADPPRATAAQPLVFRSRQGRGVLWATVLGSGMAQLDATVVNVALPRIGTDLNAGLTSLQWTLNAYTLTLSGLLLLGGSLGDRFGRRRIFQLGIIWFTIASIGCAVAPDVVSLIALRALQGVGGALLTPGSLAILQAVFRRDDRGTAVGAWSGLGGVASAIGPVVGGVLIGWGAWGWRFAFLINVPLGIAVVLLARRFVPETRDEQAGGRLDIPGAVLASLGLAGVVQGLTDGPAGGWTVFPIVALVGGLLLLAAFVLVELRRQHPLLPMSLFANRQFTGANLTTLAVYAALSGALFLLPVTLQRSAGYSPLAAGSALLPLTAVMLVLSPQAGKVSTRIGPRWPMMIGPIVAGIGMAMLTLIGRNSSYLTHVLPAVLVFAVGMSITVAPLTTTVLAAAPNHLAGIASAVNNDVARVAGLLAVAVLPGLAGITPAVYADADALTSGFHRAVLLAGALCAAGGVLAFAMIRRVPDADSEDSDAA